MEKPDCFGLWNCEDKYTQGSYCDHSGECCEIALFSPEKVIAIIEEKTPEVLEGCVAIASEHAPNTKDCFGYRPCDNYVHCDIYRECSSHSQDTAQGKIGNGAIILLVEYS